MTSQGIVRLEIDVANDQQAQFQLESAHFNPVALVCSLSVVYKKMGCPVIYS